ncbi:MAG: Tim44 domain-containing protein [Alphaproteobacteria bacterium]|nr:Tim44 domain-containing protein [Alphaproteobacteria bacterium]
MNDSSLIEYVILGGLAVFLIKQLYSVLGTNPDDLDNDIATKTKNTFQDKNVKSDKEISEIGATIIDLSEKLKTNTNNNDYKNVEKTEETSEITKTLTKIQKQDPYFNEKDFEYGACSAFELILNAFAEEDEETLSQLLNDNVLNQFMEAVRQRIVAEERMQINIVGVTSCEIINAEIKDYEAILTVQFVSEQINTTENRQTQKIIAGDSSQVNTIQDIWTFSRDIDSTNPNWTLVATSSPEH